MIISNILLGILFWIICGILGRFILWKAFEPENDITLSYLVASSVWGVVLLVVSTFAVTWKILSSNVVIFKGKSK